MSGANTPLRHAVRKQHLQLLLEQVGKLFEARARGMKFVVPGGCLLQQRALRVDERDLWAGQRRQHRRKLLQHRLDHRLARRKRREFAQIERRLQPGTEEADSPAVWNGEVVALKHQMGCGLSWSRSVIRSS